MAHHQGHVPLPADTPTSQYPSDAFVHGVGLGNGPDNSFDNAWSSLSAGHMDLGGETGYWQPHLDPSQPHNLSGHAASSSSYYHHSSVPSSEYPGSNAFENYSSAPFRSATSLQSQPPAAQPFRSQTIHAQLDHAQGGTIAPNVLQSAHAAPGPSEQQQQQPPPSQQPSFTNAAVQSLPPQPQLARLIPTPPSGPQEGRFFTTSLESLNSVVSTRPFAAFADVGLQPVAEIARSTIPMYNARRSRNEIRALLAGNSRLSASINKKTSKKLGAPKPAKKPVQLDAAGQLQVQKTSQSSSESSSEEESDYESSDDEEEPSPLAPRRPDTYSGSTEYDTIKALWRPRNRILPVAEIRDGLKAFWEVVQTIRERWASDRTAVKQAEETKKTGELPMLKERVATQRQMLEIALSTAVKHGHPDIVKHFGENLAMMGCFAVFLQDRSKDLDWSGSFARAILELLVRCTTLTDGNLEKSNVGKMLPRFQKRGDADVKALAKKIADNAVTATKRKKEAAKTAASSSAHVKDGRDANGAAAKQAAPVAGVKRERGSDAQESQPLKKVAAAVSRPLNKDAASTKPNVTTSNSTPSAANGVLGATAKPKTNTVTPKASGFFALQSASKRPGTSIAAQAANAAKSSTASGAAPAPAAAAAATTTASATSDSKSFSVFNFIEESKKPEAKPKAKTEEKRAPETQEERTRRERKEKRRHLRVHWKPEAALVDVRLFSHDPDEELGHDASQVKDVGDIGSEGAMFKMQHRHETDMFDEEEDEEAEAEAAKLFGREYPALVDVDFSDLAEKEPDQYNMLFAPHGGSKREVDSPERKVQQQRESNVLAVYYNKENLPPPPNPQDPVEDVKQPDKEPTAFGQPPEQVTSRLAALERRQQPQPPSSQPAQFDLAALLGSLGGQSASTSNYSQPPIPPTAPPMSSPPSQAHGGLSALDQALSLMRNNQQSAMPQPPPPPPPPSAPAAQPPAFDLAALLGSIAQSQPAAGNQRPQPQAAAAPTPAAPAQPVIPSDLASILQGLQSAPQVPQVPGMPSLADFMAQGGFPMGNGQQQQPSSNGGAQYPYENEDRKRWREQQDGTGNGYDGNNDDDNDRYNKRVKWNKPGERGSKPVPQFVVECRYFQEGKCKKGKDCTYLHNGVAGGP